MQLNLLLCFEMPLGVGCRGGLSFQLVASRKKIDVQTKSVGYNIMDNIINNDKSESMLGLPFKMLQYGCYKWGRS